GHTAQVALRPDGDAVHEVDVVLAGARVALHDVGPAVAVEVPGSRDRPVEIGYGSKIPLVAENLRAIHRIEVVLPCAACTLVAPQDGRAAGAEEVGARGMKNDLANSLVAIVRNVKIAACIQRHTAWVAKARARRRTAIARGALDGTARHRRDDPRRRSDLANSVVEL